MATLYARLIVAVLVVTFSTLTTVIAQEASTGKPPQQKKKAPVAKSHEELAQLLASALDKKDYKAVMSLMVPPTLYAELGAPEKHRKRYAEQVARTPVLAKMLHAHLKFRKLTPLKGKAFQKHDSKTAQKRTLAGKTLEQSTGIRLIKDDGTILYEVADMATAIDGRWYVMQLVDPRTEKLIKKDIPDVIGPAKD